MTPTSLPSLVSIAIVAACLSGCGSRPTLESASDGQTIIYVSIEAVREGLEPHEAQCFEPAMAVIGGYLASARWEGMGWQEISGLWVEHLNEDYIRAREDFEQVDEAPFEAALQLAQERLSMLSIEGTLEAEASPDRFGYTRDRRVFHWEITNNSDVSIVSAEFDLLSSDGRQLCLASTTWTETDMPEDWSIGPIGARRLSLCQLLGAGNSEIFYPPVAPGEVRQFQAAAALESYEAYVERLSTAASDEVDTSGELTIEGVFEDFRSGEGSYTHERGGDIQRASERLSSMRERNARQARQLAAALAPMRLAHECQLDGLIDWRE